LFVCFVFFKFFYMCQNRNKGIPEALKRDFWGFWHLGTCQEQVCWPPLLCKFCWAICLYLCYKRLQWWMVMSGGTASDFRFCRCRVAGVYMLFHHQRNGLISVKNSANSTNAFWSHQHICCHSNVYWYYNTLQIQ